MAIGGSRLSAGHERVRIAALNGLSGVALPTASVMLHFAHGDPYPILDARALQSLGVPTPPSSYTHDFWMAYVNCCRALADAHGMTMRALDRALWQHSKEAGVPLR